MSRPKALDACCGVGGATKGLQRAGFDVTGIDIADQPDYCGDLFIQGDAVEYVAKHGHKYDFILAGWPCQAANPLTTGTNKGKFSYPQLIPGGREAMESTGKPWIIENTAGAPIRKDLTLNGDMFQEADGTYRLGVFRPRFFECSPGLVIPQPVGPRKASRGRVRGWRHGEYFDGPYVAVYGNGGGKGSVAEWQDAMGIHWTTNRKSLAEAIPPAYTEYIGTHVLNALSVRI